MAPFRKTAAVALALSIGAGDPAQAASGRLKHPRTTPPPAIERQTAEPRASAPYPEPPYPNVVPIDKTGNYGAR